MTTNTEIQIQLFRDYTGASRQTALNAVRSSMRGIRAGSPAQARLEAQMFAEFGRLGGEYWAHPLGISRVWDRPTGLVVWLDSHTTLSTGEPLPAAVAMIESLLPYWEPGSEVFGVPGLRVAGYRDGLRLQSVRSGGGAVTLYGVRGTSWRQILRDRSAALAAAGTVPLWTEPRLTTSEIDHLTSFPDVGASRQTIAWLGSGLLRRINLLYSHTDAYSVHAWVTGTRWSVEFSSSGAAEQGHDHFASMLAHRSFGLPLEVAHRHCSCAMRQGHRPETFCRIEMRAPNLEGRVDLRFQQWVAEPTRHRRAFVDVGASPAWLDRVLPQGSSHRAGAPR